MNNIFRIIDNKKIPFFILNEQSKRKYNEDRGFIFQNDIF